MAKVSKPFMPEDYMTVSEALEVAADLEKRIAELEAALRAIIERIEYRMSSAATDDIVALARKALGEKD
jgi:hypothetical protein